MFTTTSKKTQLRTRKICFGLKKELVQMRIIWFDLIRIAIIHPILSVLLLSFVLFCIFGGLMYLYYRLKYTVGSAYFNELYGYLCVCLCSVILISLVFVLMSVFSLWTTLPEYNNYNDYIKTTTIRYNTFNYSLDSDGDVNIITVKTKHGSKTFENYDDIDPLSESYVVQTVASTKVKKRFVTYTFTKPKRKLTRVEKYIYSQNKRLNPNTVTIHKPLR
jgi:hypothetical protein